MAFEYTIKKKKGVYGSNFTHELDVQQVRGYPFHTTQTNVDILELFGNSLCLHLVSGPAFTPYPSLSAIGKVRQFLLNLSMKYWNSAFNAQGSSLNIVVVQVGPVKIYAAAVKEKWKTGWNSFYHQNYWKN